MSDDVFDRMERANPVPDPERLAESGIDLAHFRAAVEHRRLHARDGLLAGGGDRVWRPVLIATAAALVVLVSLGSAYVLLLDRSRSGDVVGPQPPPPTLTTIAAAPSTTAATSPTTTATPATTTRQAPATTVAPQPGDARPFARDPTFALFTDSKYTEPGAIVFHDGVWHMFYRSLDFDQLYTGAPSIGWATSEDGRQWERRSELATVATLGIPYGNWLSAQPDSAVVLDDGTWAVYFHTTAVRVINGSGVIGVMTAPGPEGPWTVHPTPVVEPGPAGSWDSEGVGNAHVLRLDGELWMYYDGHQGDSEDVGDRSIGLAFSVDGFSWAKYDDPGTTEDRFARSDPVLTPRDGWDRGRVFDPGVVRTADGFVMTYLSRNTDPNLRLPNGQTFRYWFGLATSRDGIRWAADPGGPFFDHVANGFNYTNSSILIHTGDTYVLLADLEAGGPGGYRGDTWYLAHEGSIWLEEP